MTARPTETFDDGKVLEVVSARKRFGAVIALDDVSLELRRGEVLALLGDNGAGKSTLIKAISGVHRLDSGELRVDAKDVSIKSPADARALGIETVYQDLALFDNLDASANLYFGRERTAPTWLGRAAVLRTRQMETETRRILERLGVRVPSPSSGVRLLSGGQRQAIACARVVAFAGRIAILDEPTAALGVRESRHVLEMVRRLPEEGVSVILISHNLEHVTKVADRAVVLRGGRNVGEAVPSTDNHERIVSLIVGSANGEETPQEVTRQAQTSGGHDQQKRTITKK